MIRVENVSKWSMRQLAPYMSGILEQFGKLEDRFPRDCTARTLFDEIYSGTKALWLVLSDDRLLATALSHIRTVDATGARIATLCDLAGEDVETYAAELNAALEAWGAENNCELFAVEGRIGWGKLLKRFGYETHAVCYRKRAVNG